MVNGKELIHVAYCMYMHGMYSSVSHTYIYKGEHEYFWQPILACNTFIYCFLFVQENVNIRDR